MSKEKILRIVRAIPHEDLLTEFCRVTLLKEDSYGTNPDNPYKGHVSSSHVAETLVAGTSRTELWISYLIEKGYARDRDNWCDWGRGLSWERYKGVIDGFSCPVTQFAEHAVTGALIRMRNHTGWIERDDYGWKLTEAGEAKLDEMEDRLAELQTAADY